MSIKPILLAFLLLSCQTIAIKTAPKKQNTSPSPRAIKLNETFFESLHNAKYKDIESLLEKHKREYLKTPTDSLTASHIGFLHIWKLSERAKNKKLEASITDNASLCKKYFTEAYELKNDPRYLGFKASCILAEASIHHIEKREKKRILYDEKAVSDWPEFNYFTAGYVFSNTDWNSKIYKGLEMQWKTRYLH